jgi:hypothetical protein
MAACALEGLGKLLQLGGGGGGGRWEHDEERGRRREAKDGEKGTWGRVNHM